jgi:hypothetical protein
MGSMAALARCEPAKLFECMNYMRPLSLHVAGRPPQVSMRGHLRGASEIRIPMIESSPNMGASQELAKSPFDSLQFER